MLETPRSRAAHYEALIRRYMRACCDADVDAIRACLTEDAEHYFPPSMYGGPLRGGSTIANFWARAVRDLGSYWTVDRLIVDPESHQAVAEWTHFKRKQNIVLRGDEWYDFDQAAGLIREIRAYYASPQAGDLQRLELAGFDYAGRGYPMLPPDE